MSCFFGTKNKINYEETTDQILDDEDRQVAYYKNDKEERLNLLT